MTDLVLQREFAHPIERVFTFISDPDLVMQWWGPDYVVSRKGQFDFTKPGPWELIMEIDDGRTVRVSGQVIKVTVPTEIHYTWAWDTPEGRGHESNVTMLLEPNGTGTKLTLTHANLPDDDRNGHGEGWNSTLNNLQKFAATQPN